MYKLSNLKQVELRDVWKNEAADFTKWLSREENMDLLGKVIGGIELRCKDVEASVGDFNLDILAEDINTGEIIAIENQLERTDHDHLGKLITYTAGYDASMVIWIVKESREEHIKAIQWLNDKTSDDIKFFLLEIQVWQIDDSNPAPRFQVVESPNNWSKQLKTIKRVEKEATKTDLLKLEFWQGLKKYCKENNLHNLTQTPGMSYWYSIRIGTSKANINLRLNTNTKTINCELIIHEDKDLFVRLYKHKESIETQMAQSLIWENKEDLKHCKIYVQDKISIDDKDDWSNTYEWLAKNITLFKKAFIPHIK